mmetsp:Transcript_17006/g.39549  ORF Transcript_17006/g.39549 Transcript_17006/m.39549 type:complete len:237 (-) Transcript_17006:14-724(-)
MSRSPPSDERHLARHDRHAKHVRARRQRRHRPDGPRRVVHAERRLGPHRPVRLGHSRSHAVPAPSDRARHVGRDVAEVDLADGHVHRPAVEGQALREAEDSVLRRRVRRAARPGGVGADRAVVYYPSPPRGLLRRHYGHGRLGHPPDGRDVRLDDPAEVVRLDRLGRRGGDVDPGVVEEEVDPAEVPPHRFGQVDHVAFGRDVRGHGEDVGVGPGTQAFRLVQRAGPSPRQDERHP